MKFIEEVVLKNRECQRIINKHQENIDSALAKLNKVVELFPESHFYVDWAWGEINKLTKELGAPITMVDRPKFDFEDVPVPDGPYYIDDFEVM